jgi:hypothetical protein
MGRVVPKENVDDLLKTFMYEWLPAGECVYATAESMGLTSQMQYLIAGKLSPISR